MVYDFVTAPLISLYSIWGKLDFHFHRLYNLQLLHHMQILRRLDHGVGISHRLIRVWASHIPVMQ